MNIQLPPKIDGDRTHVDSRILVVLGANGSGKTRFGVSIEQQYDLISHRIAAQKSLSMPASVSPKSMQSATNEFLYGRSATQSHHKTVRRWNNNPSIHLLNDYDDLLVLLHTDEYRVSIAFKESYMPGQTSPKAVTNLDKIKRIWENVLPHRKLKITPGSIEVLSPNDQGSYLYNGAEMSDGERMIFYMIGEVVSVPPNFLIIIDEPEMHIHKSIVKKLWDQIEMERPDCTFVYLTHDVDFAISRHDSIKIWVKGFSGATWDYEVLHNNSPIPQQLYLEILGSRKPVLFIEGDNSSIDYKIFQLVFSEYTTIPVGSGSKVIEVAKSFADQNQFHHIDSFGLIDRDRRTDDEIQHLNHPNIWISQVAEIENFLLLEEVVRLVAAGMHKDSDEVFAKVKTNIIDFFKSQLDKQALEHTISVTERHFKVTMDNSKIKGIDELGHRLDDFVTAENYRKTFTQIQERFRSFIATGDYNSILKNFNNKGMIFKSEVIIQCDLIDADAYLNFIIGILKKNNDSTNIVRTAIRQKIDGLPTQHS